MSYRAILAPLFALLVAAPSLAKNAPPAIVVVGDTEAQITVNGKPYIPGAPLPNKAMVVINGPGGIFKIGGLTIQTDIGKTELKVTGDLINVIVGLITVTGSDGKTQTFGAGQKVSIAAAPATPENNTSWTSAPGPGPKSNLNVSSPSGP